MKFEFLTEKLVETAKEPIASLTKNGVITFNAAAIRQYKIKDKQLVMLGYDKKTTTIGIKLISKPADGAKKIRVAPRIHRSAQVGATRFLRFFKITQKGRFPLNWDKKEKTFYFALKF
jgi:hypothetical protein